MATSTDSCPVKGLQLIADYVSEEEEQVGQYGATNLYALLTCCMLYCACSLCMHANNDRADLLCHVQALLKCAEEGQWQTVARRRVCHFGYRFEYQVLREFSSMRSPLHWRNTPKLADHACECRHALSILTSQHRLFLKPCKPFWTGSDSILTCPRSVILSVEIAVTCIL